MQDIIISLIAPLAATIGTTIISKVALKIMKSISKKSDKKVELLERQNALLKEENRDLKESLRNIEKAVSINIQNQNDTVEKVHLMLDIQKSQNELMKENLNCETTIRNELKTLLKKED